MSSGNDLWQAAREYRICQVRTLPPVREPRRSIMLPGSQQITVAFGDHVRPLRAGPRFASVNDALRAATKASIFLYVWKGNDLLLVLNYEDLFTRLYDKKMRQSAHKLFHPKAVTQIWDVLYRYAHWRVRHALLQVRLTAGVFDQ